MSRDQKLSALVSGVSPLGKALDGTPTKKNRAPARRTTKIDDEVVEKFGCRACGFRTDERSDFQAHLISEIAALQGDLEELIGIGRARSRRAYANNPQVRKDAIARWRARNPQWREQQNAHNRARKARKRAERETGIRDPRMPGPDGRCPPKCECGRHRRRPTGVVA